MTGIKFFVPFAQDAAQAERIYEGMIKSSRLYELLRPEARLYSLTFQHDGETYRATVGETIQGWRDRVGVVLAIIETQQLVYVHTYRETDDRTGTILAGHPDDCRARQWFADFPPHELPRI